MSTTVRRQRPCANRDCAGIAGDSIYCEACAPGPFLGPVDDPDIVVLILRERLVGGGRLTRRLARYGHAACGVCSGPSLPGRLYCSPRCRWLAINHGRAVRIEMDGITATPLEHARRIGMSGSTLYKRLQLGMGPREALLVPIGIRRNRSRSRTGDGAWRSCTS